MANINTQEKTSTTGWTRINSPIKNNRENSPVVFSTDISWNDIESTLANHQILGEYFTNGKLTSLSIIKILEYIIGQIEQVPEPTPEEQTYYWYAGQTQPISMDSDPEVDDENFTNNKWHTLGTTLPTTINQRVRGGTAGNEWFVVTPKDQYVPTASDLSTPDGSQSVIETITIGTMQYDVWSTGVETKSKNIWFKKL